MSRVPNARPMRWVVARGVLVAAAVMAVAAATACGSSGSGGASAGSGDKPADKPAVKLFADDFKPVCEGAPVSAAKPYDAAAAGHKAVYLKTYKDSGLLDSSTDLPDDWTVKFDPNGDVYASIDVVICAKRVSAKLAASCDGYKVDGKPDALVVKMHTARYAVTAHEATTGKELGKTTVAATDGSCPQSIFGIDKGTTEMNEYASPPSEKIVAFAKKYLQA